MDVQAVVATIFATWAVAISAAVISLMIAKSKGESQGDSVRELKKSFEEMKNQVAESMKAQEERVTQTLMKQDLRQDNFFKTEIQELKSILHNLKDVG